MVYLVVENKFRQYPWCQRILRGLHEEVKRKKVELQEIDGVVYSGMQGDSVLLVGASQEWIEVMAMRARNARMYPIVLSNRQPGVSNYTISSVTMDIHSSMQLAVDYLRSIGAQKLALYGVNPQSSSDKWRAIRFEELTGCPKNIFFCTDTMEEVFCSFYKQIEHYDGAICVSDYAAVSLIRRLKQKCYPVPDNLRIVSYGDMSLAKLIYPSITSITDDYENFGRAALSISSTVNKNDTISAINIHLRSRLNIRQTTGCKPYRDTHNEIEIKSVQENLFYADQEMSDLAKLETLFAHCDETDFSIIQLIRQSAPYTRIAQECYISETAAKYRVKKMEKLCGVASRQELISYIEYFL